MTRLSTGQFRNVIEEYFEDRNMAIDCRRRRRGYSLYCSNDDTPLARLCPTGEDDIVEIDWWDGNHWKSVTEFGLALPLPEALEYITDDADGVFFDGYEDYGYEDDDELPADVIAPNPVVIDLISRSAFQLTVGETVCFTLLGAACGGMVDGASWGLLYGAGAAMAFCLVHSLVTSLLRNAIVDVLFSGLPSMVLAGASGAAGAAVRHTLGGGLWSSIGGAVVALACAYLISRAAWPAWVVGFAAGLNLGISLADRLDIRQDFLGAAVIALLAVCSAALCRKVGSTVKTAICDSVEARASG